jgi:hypothetical protein
MRARISLHKCSCAVRGGGIWGADPPCQGPRGAMSMTHPSRLKGYVCAAVCLLWMVTRVACSRHSSIQWLVFLIAWAFLYLARVALRFGPTIAPVLVSSATTQRRRCTAT